VPAPLRVTKCVTCRYCVLSMTAARLPDTVIRIEGVTRTNHVGDIDVHALAGVDLTVMRGEFVAIMGSSGSGKSTLMSILGCLDRPSTGRYLLDGIDVASLPEPDLARIRSERLGFVFQSFNLASRTSDAGADFGRREDRSRPRKYFPRVPRVDWLRNYSRPGPCGTILDQTPLLIGRNVARDRALFENELDEETRQRRRRLPSRARCRWVLAGTPRRQWGVNRKC